MALRVIRQAGGFAVRTPGAGFARAAGLDAHLWTKVEHILVLYGADFFGHVADRRDHAAAFIWSASGWSSCGVVDGGPAVLPRRRASCVQILTASFVTGAGRVRASGSGSGPGRRSRCCRSARCWPGGCCPSRGDPGGSCPRSPPCLPATACAYSTTRLGRRRSARISGSRPGWRRITCGTGWPRTGRPAA